MKSKSPIVKDLVLVGGGHSHLSVLKEMGMAPVDGLRVTLVTRRVHTPYSGMLPGLVAGQYTRQEAHIDLRPLCHFAGARLYQDTVVGVDLDHRQLRCADRPPVGFDLVSFNIGSRPSTGGVDGAAKYATPVKPIEAFLSRLERWCGQLADQPASRWRVAVVGGGAGGVELTLSLERRLRDIAADAARPHISLFSASSRLLEDRPKGVSRRFSRILAQRRVDVHTGCRIARVEPHTLVDAEGRSHDFDALIWVTDAAAPDWVAKSGLATDDAGFIQVDDHLRSTSHDFVFAAGDIASMVGRQVAKSGVYAVRQGKPLAANVRRAAEHRPLQTYRPQKTFLSLIGTGDGRAVGSRGPLSVGGKWVWRAKQWIDRRWMRQWDELPEMDDPDVPTSPDAAGPDDGLDAIATPAMRCGGCGAKLGSDVLSRVLDRLGAAGAPEVVVGLDAADDCAVIRPPEGKLQVQTIDFFRTFLDDPYTFGRIAANHCLGDIWAMGAAPISALAVAVVPFASEPKIEQDLYELMSGAVEVIENAGAALVGGHSSEGHEMAFGLQVTGAVDQAAMLQKSGMHPGDQLVLTKPVGTGTLFAADMRRKARGRWIVAAIEQMSRSNRHAAMCFQAHRATACTDVTGFGVLGHLVEMTDASGVGARLNLDALPVLDGAVETIEAGIVSSLAPDNRRLRRAIDNVQTHVDHPHYPLLFDPQTAGGLLAAVPADHAHATVGALRQAGCARAAIIGQVEARPDQTRRAIRLESTVSPFK